jgi:hypothetical protein
MIKVHFKEIRPKIIRELGSAKKSIRVAVYWFTNLELLDSLLFKLKKGVKVTLIIHNDYINNRETGLDFQSFIEAGGNFFFSDSYNPMHNKFCIVDEKILINGSYNWTYYAETRNSENILIIKREKAIIRAFIEEFDRIISYSEQVEKIVPLKKLEIIDSKMLGTREYLAREMIYQAKSQNKIEIVDQAFEIIPYNIEIQRIACDLDLKKRLKLKHSIGASLKGDKYLVIIPKGSIIPFANCEIVQTSEDNQVTSSSSIYYGENPIASKNYKIGILKVYGLPPKPAGESKLKFVASIDLSGYFKLEKISVDTGTFDHLSKSIKSFLEE